MSEWERVKARLPEGIPIDWSPVERAELVAELEVLGPVTVTHDDVRRQLGLPVRPSG